MKENMIIDMKDFFTYFIVTFMLFTKLMFPEKIFYPLRNQSNPTVFALYSKNLHTTHT